MTDTFNMTIDELRAEVERLSTLVEKYISKTVIESDAAISEEWLRNFCSTSDCPSYETVMEAIRGEYPSKDDVYTDHHGVEHRIKDYYQGTVYSDYFFFGGQNAHGEIPPEFWDHVEVVLGVKQTKRPEYFSCSC